MGQSGLVGHRVHASPNHDQLQASFCTISSSDVSRCPPANSSGSVGGLHGWVVSAAWALAPHSTVIASASAVDVSPVGDVLCACLPKRESRYVLNAVATAGLFGAAVTRVFDTEDQLVCLFAGFLALLVACLIHLAGGQTLWVGELVGGVTVGYGGTLGRLDDPTATRPLHHWLARMSPHPVGGRESWVDPPTRVTRASVHHLTPAVSSPPLPSLPPPFLPEGDAAPRRGHSRHPSAVPRLLPVHRRLEHREVCDRQHVPRFRHGTSAADSPRLPRRSHPEHIVSPAAASQPASNASRQGGRQAMDTDRWAAST